MGVPFWLWTTPVTSAASRIVRVPSATAPATTTSGIRSASTSLHAGGFRCTEYVPGGATTE